MSIEIYYVEQIKPHGNSIFYFLESAQDIEDWKQRGYKTQDEVNQLAMKKNDKQGPMAGIPISQQSSTHDPQKIIQKLTTTWKRLTWKDWNTIFSKCLKNVTGADGQSRNDLDVILYREMKLKFCLKDWDLKDDNGAKVQVSSEIIDMLAPEVATALLDNFETVTEATADDLGESNG